MDKKQQQPLPPIDLDMLEIDKLLLEEAKDFEEDGVDCGTWDEDLKILAEYGF